jgi:ATP-dependent phosphoenolpyruvate carboxykinase
MVDLSIVMLVYRRVASTTGLKVYLRNTGHTKGGFGMAIGNS